MGLFDELRGPQLRDVVTRLTVIRRAAAAAEAQSDPERAFERFLQVYGSAMKGHVLRTLSRLGWRSRDENFADEVVQEFMYKAWGRQALSKAVHEPVRSFKAWLCTALTRQSISLYRKARSRGHHVHEAAMRRAQTSDVECTSPEHDFTIIYATERLRRALHLWSGMNAESSRIALIRYLVARGFALDDLLDRSDASPSPGTLSTAKSSFTRPILTSLSEGPSGRLDEEIDEIERAAARLAARRRRPRRLGS